MKLTYKILWLDDKIQEFIDGKVIDEVESHIKDLGFNPEIITVSQTAKFFKSLNNGNEFDLILTDYHLNGTDNGDEVIKKIRSQDFSVMTEILFYTARADLKDTEKISRVSFLETSKKPGGSHEEHIIHEVKLLIDLTVKKFQHIIAMRGMIMHETSFLDSKMLEIIEKVLHIKDLISNEQVNKICDKLISLFDKKKQFVEQCKKSSNLNKLIKDNFVYSSSYKIQTLSIILQNLNLNDFSKEYLEKIIQIRNKFAHSKLLKDGEGKEYFKDGESNLHFDEKFCKKIRKDISEQHENIKKLSDKVFPQSATGIK